MYEEIDVDATFHIPVSSVVKAAVEEAKKREEAAPVVIEEQAPVQQPSSPVVSVAQTTPVQTVPVSSFIPIQYATGATTDDKKLYAELSAVSDEVIACRNAILKNVY